MKNIKYNVENCGRCERRKWRCMMLNDGGCREKKIENTKR
jgi:hypothetical protein